MKLLITVLLMSISTSVFATDPVDEFLSSKEGKYASAVMAYLGAISSARVLDIKTQETVVALENFSKVESKINNLKPNISLSNAMKVPLGEGVDFISEQTENLKKISTLKANYQKDLAKFKVMLKAAEEGNVVKARSLAKSFSSKKIVKIGEFKLEAKNLYNKKIPPWKKAGDAIQASNAANNKIVDLNKKIADVKSDLSNLGDLEAIDELSDAIAKGKDIDLDPSVFKKIGGVTLKAFEVAGVIGDLAQVYSVGSKVWNNTATISDLSGGIGATTALLALKVPAAKAAAPYVVLVESTRQSMSSTAGLISLYDDQRHFSIEIKDMSNEKLNPIQMKQYHEHYVNLYISNFKISQAKIAQATAEGNKKLIDALYQNLKLDIEFMNNLKESDGQGYTDKFSWAALLGFNIDPKLINQFNAILDLEDSLGEMYLSSISMVEAVNLSSAFENDRSADFINVVNNEIKVQETLAVRYEADKSQDKIESDELRNKIIARNEENKKQRTQELKDKIIERNKNNQEQREKDLRVQELQNKIIAGNQKKKEQRIQELKERIIARNKENQEKTNVVRECYVCDTNMVNTITYVNQGSNSTIGASSTYASGDGQVDSTLSNYKQLTGREQAAVSTNTTAYASSDWTLVSGDESLHITRGSSFGSVALADNSEITALNNAGVESTVMQKTITLPTGVRQVTVDMMANFVTNEYPGFVGTEFNDSALIEVRTGSGNVYQATLFDKQLNSSNFTDVTNLPSPMVGEGGETGFESIQQVIPVANGGELQITVTTTNVGDVKMPSATLVNGTTVK